MIPIGKIIVDHMYSVTAFPDAAIINSWFWNVEFRSKNNAFDSLVYHTGMEPDFGTLIEDVMYKELNIGYVT